MRTSPLSATLSPPADGGNGRNPDMWVAWFSDLSIADVPVVGGKNASLGEMRRELSTLGIPVPDGFAVTADAFREFLRANRLENSINTLLEGRERDDVAGLERRSHAIRDLVLAATIPPAVRDAVIEHYHELSGRLGTDGSRSCRPLLGDRRRPPGASFAGAHETVLNVRGSAELLDAVRRCYREPLHAAGDPVPRRHGFRARMRSPLRSASSRCSPPMRRCRA